MITWLRAEKIGLATAAVLFWAGLGGFAFADSGEATYKTSCAMCHHIGKGKLVGPDLAGVNERREQSWLVSFIKSSTTMVKNGDPIATKLLKEFSGIVMPDQPFGDEKIKEVLAYIKSVGNPGTASTTPAEATSTAAVEVKDAAPEDIIRGQDLFQGKERFANGGASCISCHDVRNDAVIGGGVLAKELTDVFTRMGGSGVQAILGSPPFAVMQQAYKGKDLMPDEIVALVAFLQDSDKQKLYSEPRDYGVKLFYSGIGGTFILLCAFASAYYLERYCI